MQFIRFLAPLSDPVVLIWSFNLIVAITLLFQGKRRKAIIPLITCIFLFLVGSTNLPVFLFKSLEESVMPDASDKDLKADAVIVLGGTLGLSNFDAFSLNLSSAGDRIMKGVELVRGGKAERLVLTGPDYDDRATNPISEPELIRNWLKAWGLNIELVTVRGTQSSYDEAIKVRDLVITNRWKKVIIVSSAYHLPRAAAVFRKQVPAEIIPIGCDFQVLGIPESRTSRIHLPFSFFPKKENLNLFRWYVHEMFGKLIYHWKGWT